jgi:hypothetical protein
MPFPLAHPAAVLPLRRYCPRWLWLPALVIGSVIPDIGYLLPGEGPSDLSHQLIAGTGFGVLGGLAVLGLISVALPLWLPLVPITYRDELRRGLHLAPRMVPSIILSLALGTWTHLFLDAFTHAHSWLAEHWSLLRTPIVFVHGRDLRVCHLLWYLCSFIGLAWLVFAIREWQQGHLKQPGSRRSHIFEGVVVALLVLPIEVLHHFVRSLLGMLLVAAFSLLLSALVFARPLLEQKLRRQVFPEGLQRTETEAIDSSPGKGAAIPES